MTFPPEQHPHSHSREKATRPRASQGKELNFGPNNSPEKLLHHHHLLLLVFQWNFSFILPFHHLAAAAGAAVNDSGRSVELLAGPHCRLGWLAGGLHLGWLSVGALCRRLGQVKRNNKSY